MILPSSEIEDFQQLIHNFYNQHGRTLPWRPPLLPVRPDGTLDPYAILTSELMLQQTQVTRVIPKFSLFMKQFPDVASLAAANLGDVLRVWSGLGYNRRAKFLWQTAQIVVTDYDGTIPVHQNELLRLPGVGANTAGAILAYAFNQLAVFIETNIRTVYLHHFFSGKVQVSDKSILGLVSQTLDTSRPREFYWGLMDYGTHLKATAGNLLSLSSVHAKQSAFIGSRRQVRGQVLRLLSAKDFKLAELKAAISDNRLQDVLDELRAEGFIVRNGGLYRLG